MKTAVSIPDDVYMRAEGLARRLNTSRSRLYSQALEEYVARHSPDQVTEAMNKVCEDLGADHDAFVAEAAQRVLERSEW